MLIEKRSKQVVMELILWKYDQPGPNFLIPINSSIQIHFYIKKFVGSFGHAKHGNPFLIAKTK